MQVFYADELKGAIGSVRYSVEVMAANLGDAAIINPRNPYDGVYLKPKGKWVEIHTEQRFREIHYDLWSSSAQLDGVIGVIAGLPEEQAVRLARGAIDQNFEVQNSSRPVLCLNGPNLNLLGQRQPEIYGHETLGDIEASMVQLSPNGNLSFFQSNMEGELIEAIQNARGKQEAIILNAAAYTHTSIAILDALNAYDGLVIELHLSNPHQREPFRQQSYISPNADIIMTGFGAIGYSMALVAALEILN